MKLFYVAIFCILVPLSSSTQEMSGDRSQKQGGVQEKPRSADMGQMPGMNMNSNAPMNMARETFVEKILAHDTSSTSAQPNSTPTPMLMKTFRAWTLMFHGNVFILDEQQTGPRGADKFFSTNWLMGMAQHKLGNGLFTIRNMLTIEPATVTDFVMELAVLYDLKLSENALFSFYFAPVGDPAIGPTAYPHRASASEDPVAALSHHQQDSTHVAADVITGGLTYCILRIEASGFHGREPDEFRWDIDQGKIDSWSARLTIQPRRNWSGQYSYGRITRPKAVFPC